MMEKTDSTISLIIFFIGIILIFSGCSAEVVDKQPKSEYEKKALSIYQKDFKKSVHYANEDIRLHPNEVRPYLTRGIVYGYWGEKLKNKQYAAQAWNDYSFCIDKANSNEFKVSQAELADIYVRRGTMSMLGSAHAQGIADYEMSCKLNGQRCKGLDLLRLLYLTNKK